MIENENESFDVSADNVHTISLKESSFTILEKESIQENKKDSQSLIVKKNSAKRFKSEDNPDLSKMRYSESTEKERLERNRISARECRRRRKHYLQKLETQVKELKDELTICRRQLSIYKVKEQQELFRSYNKQDIHTKDPTSNLENQPNVTSKRLMKKYIVIAFY